VRKDRILRFRCSEAEYRKVEKTANHVKMDISGASRFLINLGYAVLDKVITNSSGETIIEALYKTLTASNSEEEDSD